MISWAHSLASGDAGRLCKASYSICVGLGTRFSTYISNLSELERFPWDEKLRVEAGEQRAWSGLGCWQGWGDVISDLSLHASHSTNTGGKLLLSSPSPKPLVPNITRSCPNQVPARRNWIWNWEVTNDHVMSLWYKWIVLALSLGFIYITLFRVINHHKISRYRGNNPVIPLPYSVYCVQSRDHPRRR